MSAEIVQLMEQAGPFLSAAVAAYGAGILSRAGEATLDAAVEDTAGLGRRIVRLVWRRRDGDGRAALARAASEAADESGGGDAADGLRREIERALREDPLLAREVAALLPTQRGATVSISGARPIGAQHIGIALSGDNATIHPPKP
ncbi:hypothetical protein AB0424_06220 [Streptomyces sp. NPDC051180]|uniref:hypothetical protein n=1 Tax=Streptomyces sp. NPDC051180 TaxID=3155797 RepID=UPI00344CAFCD